jgi:hypothetical protein
MNLLEGMSRWFPSKTKIQKWIEDQERDFAEAQNNNPNLSTEDCWRNISLPIYTRYSLEESTKSYMSG